MTSAREPISVEGIDRTGMLIPIMTPMPLIVSAEEKPAAISLAGRMSAMTELIKEEEVRIPVMGMAEESRGLKARFGFLNLPPLMKK